MNLSISTGTFYQVPFQKTLALIRKAGFEYIELLPCWKGSHWEMGQHLRDISPAEALKMVEDSGLRISSLHDGGGLLEQGVSSIVSRSTYEYMACGGGGEIPCLVFHPPIKAADDLAWWEEYQAVVAQDLRQFKGSAMVCLENVFPFEGESIPLLEPAHMLEFVLEHDLYITIDTTHCAQAGIDIVEAARTFGSRVRTVHLSDYLQPKAHVFVGEGTLDLQGFARALDHKKLHAITLECDVEYHKNDESRTVERLKQARDYLNNIAEESAG